MAGKLQEAIGRFQAQDLTGAGRLCTEILESEPRHPDALHLLGVVRMLGGNPWEAAILIGKALEMAPRDAAMRENLGMAKAALGDYRSAEAAFRNALDLGAKHAQLYMRLGLALSSQGRMAEAEGEFQRAIERAPADPDIHLNLGNAYATQRREEEALACFRKAVSLNPKHVGAHFNLGTLLSRQGRFDEALEVFSELLKFAPGHPEIQNSIGLVHMQLGRQNDADRFFRQAIAAAPEFLEAYSNLGNLLRAQGKFADAAAVFEKALAFRPDFGDALVNLGNVRVDQGRLDDARLLYEQALNADSRNLEACRNLGYLFKLQGNLKEAVASYRRAVGIAPGDVASHAELAGALRDGGDFAGALDVYRKALELDPKSASTRYDLAETLKGMARFDEAIMEYEKALASKPDFHRALSGLAYLRQQVCDWSGLAGLWDRLRSDAIGRPGSGLSPFGLLYMPFSPQEQLACSREWAREHLDTISAARGQLGFEAAPQERHQRLRVGYLSWDFHKHATAYLMAELFELHDRERFEIFVYSFGPDDGSPIRARIRSAAEHFVDVAGESFVDTARRIRRDGIDVLVDLKGYTRSSRPEILALRPAPVQATWLGFPGSMGTACVDYLIADPFIVPEDKERHYAEKIVRLPDCYQVNDRRREIADSTPTRVEAGLPTDGIVFCSFNQPAKILPDVFASWMRVLKGTTGSVLWLLETNPWANGNLRREAEALGVAGERLVFAPLKPLPEHLARYQLADLALDTYPYGSHTTASDALWAGCPLVTQAGETFASRVAGSLLISAGLPELVTDSAEAYERLVLELARSPDRLQDLRRRLKEGRDTCPLFDTPRFTRNLENALRAMFEGRHAAEPATGE